MAKSNSESMALGSATGLVIASGMVFAALATPALAQIEGAQVVHGSASIEQNGSHTIIHAGDNAILNYSRFDIRAGETVQFIQPDAFARVLNRIASPEPTRIDGSLIANGQVYLVNPAGMVFGPGSVIDVGGIFAAAAHMSDQDFLNGIDRFSGVTGDVLNFGSINANFAALVGRYVENYGSIDAVDGFVTMASGDEVYIGKLGGVVYARVQAPAPAPDAQAPSVRQSGQVRARRVNLASGDLLAVAITGGSSIRGDEVSVRGGVVKVEGEIDASSATGKGGSIEILGDMLVLDRARLDASGATGGGTILVGGEYRGGGGVPTAWRTGVSRDSVLKADATAGGDGGRVIVWADDSTWFYGHASARGGASGGDGGFIEVSGKQWLTFRGTGDTFAPNGHVGQLLLDPGTLTITDAASGGDHDGDLPDILSGAANIGGNTVSWGAIDALAATSDVILEATGLITIDDVTGAAGGTITANDLVTLDLTTGSLRITSTAGAVTFSDPGDEIRTEGGDITIEALGGALTAGRLNTSGAAGTATGGAITLDSSDDISSDNLTTAGGVVAITGDSITVGDISTVGSGGSEAGGNVTISAAAGETITLAAVTVAGADVAITGDEIDLASAISSRGVGSTLTLAASDPTTTVRLAGGAAGLDLTSAELDLIAEAGGSDVAWDMLTIGSSSSTAQLIVDGNYTFADNLVEGDADSFIRLLTGGTAVLSINTNNSLDVGNNSVLFGADEVNINTNAALSGTGALVFEPNDAGDDIFIAETVGGGANVLDLTEVELDRVSTGFSSVTFGRSDGTGAITLGDNTASYVFTDPVTFLAPSGTLTTDAAVDAGGSATFDVAATIGHSITAGGAIDFSGDVAITTDLDVDAAANAITFGGDLDLAGFTLTATSSGVTFTGSPQLGGTLLATGDPVEFQGAVALGADSNVTASTIEFQDDVDLNGFTFTATTTGGITLNGTPTFGQGVFTAATQAITFEDAVTLGGTTTINADSVTFEDDVDLASFDLTVAADEIDFTGAGANLIGTGGGNATFRPEAAATDVEVAGSTTTGGLDLTATELASFDSTVDSVTIETGASGTLNVQGSPSLDSPLTLTSATGIVIFGASTTNDHDLTFDGPVTFDASLGSGDSASIDAAGTERTLSFLDTVTGNAGLDIILTADEIDFGGAVGATTGGELFIKPDSDIDVDLGGATSATATLLEVEAAELALVSGFSRVVIGDAGGTQTLTVSGAVTFSTPGVLRAGTGDIQITEVVTFGAGSSNSQIIADDIDLTGNGELAGSGTLVIFPATTTLDVDLAGSGIGGLELTAVEVGQITGSFTEVVFGRAGSTPNVGIGAAMPSLASPVEFRAITQISLGADYANGDDITFDGPVVIGGNATISAGSTIDFNSTLDAGANTLALEAGEVDFDDAVTGTGTLIVRPDLATIFVVLGGASNATGDLDLTATELAQLDSTFTLVRFGDSSLTSGVTLAGDHTFGTPVEFLGGTGEIAINADMGLGANDFRGVADSFDVDTANGSITGAGGAITIESATASRPHRFGGTDVAGTLSLTSAEIARLNGTFSLLTFGRSDGTGAMTLPAAVDLTGATFASPLAFETGTGTITVAGALTNPSDVAFAGPTTVSADVAATGSTLAFENAVTLGAGAELSGALVDVQSTLAAGAFDLTISGDEIDLAAGVSGTGDLTLRTETAARDVEVGGAAANAAALSLLAAELDLLADGWTTITIGRADSTGDLAFVGAYTFNSGLTTAGLTLLSGSGTVDVASAVDVVDNPLSILADDMSFAGGLSGTSTLALSPQSAGVGIDVGSPTVSTGGLDISDTDLAGFAGFSGLEIGDATGRTIRMDTVSVSTPLSILSTGSIVLEDDAFPGMNVGGALTLGSAGSTVTLGADVIADSITIPGDVVVAEGAEVELDSSAGGSIDISGTVEGTTGGAGEIIHFNASAVGDVVVDGAISGSAGAADATGLVDASFDAINVAIVSTAISGSLTSVGPLTGDFTSTGLVEAASIDLNAVNIDFDLGFNSGSDTEITASNLFTLGANSNAGGAFNVIGNSVLGANASSGNFMTFTGSVTLTQNVTLEVDGGASVGLIVTGAIDGTTPGFQGLIVDANAGFVTLGGPIGAGSALAGLTITGGQASIDSIGSTTDEGVVLPLSITTTGATTFTGDIYNANQQTYAAGSLVMDAGTPIGFVSSGDSISFTGPITLMNGSNLSVDSSGGSIVAGAIDGTSAEDLDLDAGAGTLAVGAIGSSVGIRSVTLTGSTVTLSGDIVAGGQAGNNVLIAGDAVLASDVTIDADGAVNDGSVTFAGRVDGTTAGAESLTVLSGSAATEFQDDVGQTALESLSATGATIALLNVTTAGAQTYTGATTLAGDLTSSGGAITLAGATTLGADVAIDSGDGDFLAAGAIDGAQVLTVDAGTGSATFQGAVGGATPLTSLDVTGLSISLSSVATTLTQSYTGATSTDGNLTTSSAALTFTGPLTLAGDTVLNTAFAGAGGNLSITGAVNSATGAESLTIGTGTAGDATLAGAIGAGSALAGLSIAGDALTLDDIGSPTQQGVTGVTSVSTSSIVFTGTAYNAGAQAYAAGSFLFNAGTPVSVDANANNLSYTGGAITLTDGTDLTLDTGVTGDLLFGAVAGTSDENFTATAGGILTAGTIGGGTQLADVLLAGDTLNLQGISGTDDLTITGDATLNADLSAGGNMTVTGSTTLGQSITITTGAGSDVLFTGPIDGTTDGGEDLTFAGDGSGSVTISGGGFGQSVRLGDLSFGAFNSLDFAEIRAASFTQAAASTSNVFNGAIDTTGGISLQGTDFTLAGTITTSAGAFSINSSGTVSFQQDTTIAGAFTQTGTSPTIFMRGDHTAAGYTFAATDLSLTGDASFDTSASGADIDLPRIGSTGLFDLDLDSGAGDLILDNGVGVAGNPIGALSATGHDLRLGAVGTPLDNGVSGAAAFTLTGSADLIAGTYRAGSFAISGAGGATLSAGSLVTFTSPGGVALNVPLLTLADGSDLSIDTSAGGGAVVLPDLVGTSHEGVEIDAGAGAVTLGSVGSNTANQIRILSVDAGVITLGGGIFTSDFDGNFVDLSGTSIVLSDDVTIDAENTTFDGRVLLSGPINDSSAGTNALVINAGSKTTLVGVQETEPETSTESTVVIAGSIGETTPLASIEINGRLVHLTGETNVIRAVGDVFFNPGDRGVIADHATIIRFRSDGAGGIDAAAADLSIQSDGQVLFGLGHRLLVLGSLTIEGDANARVTQATLVDTVALGALTVRADDIALQLHDPSTIQAVDPGASPPFDFVDPKLIEDDGVDFVSALDMTFDFGTFADVARALYATNRTGTVQGSLAQLVSPFVYEPTFGLSDVARTRTTDQTRFLDLRAQGNPDLNIAEAIAASIPREARTDDATGEASISAADRQELTRLGITVKSSDDLVGMLQSPFLILVDMPTNLDGASEGISAQRLARTPVVEAVDSFYLLMYEGLPTDSTTGRPVRDANGAVVTEGASPRAEAIYRGLQEAYTAYQDSLGEGATPDPAGFLAFVQGSTLDQVRADIADLAALFKKIDNLGLTPAEADQSKDYVLRQVRRRLPADLLRGVIEAWMQQ